MNDVIRVAWQTEVMPVPAYWYYHQECYSVHAIPLPNEQIRQVNSADVGIHATCQVCGRAISVQQQEEKRADD